MPLFRSAPDHNAVIRQFGVEGDDPSPAFVVFCDCGWNSPLLPPLTLEEVLSAAYHHDRKIAIAPAIELVVDDGGWTCFFCGTVTDATQIRLRTGWTEGREEMEQWFAAHRECLVQHAADDESIRSGPLFRT